MEPENHWVVEENRLPVRSMPSGSMWVSSQVYVDGMASIPRFSSVCEVFDAGSTPPGAVVGLPVPDLATFQMLYLDLPTMQNL